MSRLRSAGERLAVEMSTSRASAVLTRSASTRARPATRRPVAAAISGLTARHAGRGDLPDLNKEEMGQPAPSMLYGSRDIAESPPAEAMSEVSRSKEVSVSRVEPARGEVEGYEVLRADRTLAIQRERKLVNDFCAHLDASRRRYTAYRAVTSSAEIECDVYDETTHVLYEAKSEALHRPHVRMAIGQLVDYAFHCFDSRERTTLGLSLLLPHAPNPDIQELLGALGIGVAVRNGRGGFTEAHRRCNLFASS